jgi:MFS family permease
MTELSTPLVDAPPTSEEKRKRIYAIVAASSGNLVEWFDFYVYAFCAIYFAASFFPAADPTAQLLNTAGVFAAGFLMRPIGGWLFGRFADRHGRKNSLLLSVTMMCCGSLMIASLPTYHSIGAWAPALLLVARLLQGLSVGGEYGTTATYMSEVALKGQRGFFSSFQYVTLIGGQLLAVLVVVVLQQFLDEQELKAWGWRIPFVIGAITAVVALFLRRTLHETTSAATRASKEAGTLSELFRHHKAAFFTVLGYTAGGSLIFYTFTTYMQKYLVFLHVHAALLRRAFRPHRAARQYAAVRRAGCAGYGTGAHRAGQRPQSLRRLLADFPRAGHRQPVHVHQRHRQGRDVPDRSPGAGRGARLCRRQRNLRRLRRVCGAGPEIPRPRIQLLLVRDGDDGDRVYRQLPPAAAGQIPASRTMTQARARAMARALPG